MQKFSKPRLAAKTSAYFDRNAQLLADALRVNRAYVAQPPRSHCKNCEQLLGQASFESHGVPYTVCARCGHLNGLHEDTQEFLEHLYSYADGANYANDFAAAVYDAQCEQVYHPKLDFLLEVLGEHWPARTPTVLVAGCGGGHFLKVCESRRIPALGLETGAALIAMCRRHLENTPVKHCTIAEIYDAIRSSPQDVTCLLGVLEHLRHPRKALEAFRQSRAEYLYILVPIFSFSVFVEHLHTDVFPRLLSGGHTHLYTEQSLRYMADEFELDIAGEWWFGADMEDLYRTLRTAKNGSPGFCKALDAYCGPMLDELQAVIDRHRRCSEVHMVLRRRRSAR